ncbi:GNAT family N-acetyltransferase [Massilia scottii]|uniref:GNAT family N-acetyltransferase n=1 Tax=Massilia scottii TaxID=3057166 RepID=UPI002796DD0E|nr:GNAT family N-acetyltransferase [Massilia sp. CCM 9029]MDQ1830153.1 GNAT family N-acetyltransferase [Massilia sp. CCM 9029]
MSGWTSVPLQRSLGAHGAAWDQLNRRLFGDHPLLTTLFIDGLLQHFGDGGEHLCVYQRDGVTEAMCVLKRRNPLVWASFLPPQAQIAATLVADGALLPSLLASLPGMAIQLDLLCNDPAVGAVLSGAAPRRHLLNHALTMKIDLAGSFAGYWSSRSKQLQSNIKKRDKRLFENGIEQRRVHIGEAGDIVAAVDRYAALEGAGWKGRNGTAVGSTPAQHQFYRDLMQRAALDGHAFVSELWFGDTLAASRLILRRNGVYVILKTSYDESFADYSPGRLLLRDVIEQAFAADPGGAIEFYTDADQNQLEWATAQRWIQHRTLYRWNVAEALTVSLRAWRSNPQSPDGLLVEAFDHPDALPADVQTFMTKAEKHNVACGLAWYRNLVETVYPKNPGLRFYVLRHGQQLMAVLPLRAEKAGGSWQLNSLSNFYTSLYEPVLEPGLKSREMVAVLSAIQTEFPGLASLTLAPMDTASHSYQTLLGAMRIKGWIAFEYFTFGNWYQPVSFDWPTYLAARSGPLQNTIRRMRKKFAGDGGTLEIVTNPKELPVAIAAYEKVYAASWKKPEPFPAFTPGLMQAYAAKGFLRLGLAWLGGEPVAAQLWIVSHGRAEIYKLAYDERFKGYSPGTLITAMLMEHAIDKDKVNEVDYLSGDDAYKKTWMSHRRERWGLVAYNPTSLRGLTGLAREAAGRAARGVAGRLI